MNHALRVRHRRAVTILALVLPTLLLVVLVSRQEEPRVPRLPFADETAHPLTSYAFDPAGMQVEVRLEPQATPVAVWLRPLEDPREPDVLAYWVGAQDAEEAEPERYLLGALAGTQLRRLELPARFDGRGSIELVSLAHGERLGMIEIRQLLEASGSGSR